jgi:hypothetical protein
MTRSIRRNSAVLVLCLAGLAAAFACVAAAAGIHFQKESLKAYERQLGKGEVHADAFHPGTGTAHLHVSLNDGRHMTVAYASGEQSKLIAQARAKGARVQLAALKAKKAAAVKHKLRYIAGGVLIVVILIVLAVLLIGRRRALAAEAGGASGTAGSASGEGPPASSEGAAS